MSHGLTHQSHRFVEYTPNEDWQNDEVYPVQVEDYEGAQIPAGYDHEYEDEEEVYMDDYEQQPQQSSHDVPTGQFDDDDDDEDDEEEDEVAYDVDENVWVEGEEDQSMDPSFMEVPYEDDEIPVGAEQSYPVEQEYENDQIDDDEGDFDEYDPDIFEADDDVGFEGAYEADYYGQYQ